MDTTQLLKGVLDLAVLAVVCERDGYGYDVVRRLRAAGLDDVGDASVYGTLRRPSEEGPHRKYYAVNDAGRRLLAASTGTWRSFTEAMDKLLGTEGEEAA
jgi:PadR family transcriptional regulator PadR